MTTRYNNSDFDPEALTQKADEHTQQLTELQKRVVTNENFGKTFKEAAADSKAIDEAVERIVVKQLQNSKKAQGAIETIIGGVDNRQMKQQLMGVGKIVVWVATIIVTILITTWVNNVIDAANKAAEDGKRPESQQATKP